jgi:clan AA aspartic protease
MKKGVVRRREARIRLRVRGRNGRQASIEAIIDTGFTGWLTLPPALIADLQLPWEGFGHAELADGSTSDYFVYQATVLWERRPRQVIVSELNTAPLVGMGFLGGNELKIHVRPGGAVTIRPLSLSR